MKKSVCSNDNFFIFGLKNLLSKEFVNDYFTILDLDHISKDDMYEIIIRDKEIIAFASNDLSSLSADSFGKIPILDKRSSLKDILSYFMLKNESGIYRSSVALTKREKEILTLLHKGFSHESISKQLNIKSKTMYTYRRNLMNKLGCENRIYFQKLLLQTK